jgi:hypothetical protein
MRALRLGIALLLAAIHASFAEAADELQIAIIAGTHASYPGLDLAALRNIYLKRIVVDPGGQALIPVNLPPDSPLRNAFVRSVLRLPEGDLQEYWNRAYFQGITPPYVLPSQAAVVRFVAATPGAIGYVASCTVDDTVRVLLLLPLPPGSSRDALACLPHGTH